MEATRPDQGEGAAMAARGKEGGTIGELGFRDNRGSGWLHEQEP